MEAKDSQPSFEALRTQILHDYETLEPAGADTWNPVAMEWELAYRLSLLFAITRALRMTGVDVAQLRVLDLGCGNGRSTRAYLDVGLHPRQLTGIDLRPGAVALARRLHPEIDYRLSERARIDFPDGSFNWVQVSTVFSSVTDHGHRRHLAREAMRQLEPGGHLLYFDLWKANGFAGGDVLRPEALFAELDVVWSSPIRAHECLPCVDAPAGSERSLSNRLREAVKPVTRSLRLRAPSHRLLLAHKPV